MTDPVYPIVQCPRCKGKKYISGWTDQYVEAIIGGDIRDIISSVEFKKVCPVCAGVGTIPDKIGK